MLYKKRFSPACILINSYGASDASITAQYFITFQVELPLRTLLEAPAIAEMAVVISQCQAGKADPVTVFRLLAEVEALSEMQAQKLLAEEQL